MEWLLLVLHDLMENIRHNYLMKKNSIVKICYLCQNLRKFLEGPKAKDLDSNGYFKGNFVSIGQRNS